MSELRAVFAAEPLPGWLGVVEALDSHRDRETGERGRLMPLWLVPVTSDELQNVSPVDPMDDPGDGIDVDPVLSSQRPLGCPGSNALSQVNHLLRRELGLEILNSIVGGTGIVCATAPLRLPIPGVVGCCSQEQMIRSNTRGIVTAMQHPQPLGDEPVLKFPRDSVGLDGATVLSKKELTIAKRTAMTSPDPTPVTLLNLAPETVRHRHGLTPMVPEPTLPTILDEVSTTTSTEGHVRMGLHLEPPTQVRGATPRAVDSSAGALGCADYSTVTGLPEWIVDKPAWAYRPLIPGDLRQGEAASDPLPRITDAEVDALWEHEPDVWESVPAAKKRRAIGHARHNGRGVKSHG